MTITHNVYRDGKLLAEGIEGNSYTDSNVEPSTDYEYQVSAVNENGESDLSEPVEVTTEPEVTTDTVTETVDTVPYETERNETDDLPLGEEETVQEGADGYTTVTYTVTYHDGEEVDREETDRVVTDPVTEIINVGTYEEPEPEPEPEPDPEEDEDEEDE